MRSGGQYTLLTPGTTLSPQFDRISADGSKVFFTSDEDLAGATADGAVTDLFMSNGGTLTWISSPGPGASDTTEYPNLRGVSADGSRAVFESTGAFTTDDTDGGQTDVFVHELGGTTTLVSGPGNDPGSSASFGAITPDGAHIYFRTNESLLGADADGGLNDIYDRPGGSAAPTLVSVPAAGQTDNADVDFDAATANGAHVFMTTYEAMTADDTDDDGGGGGGLQDVYDRTGGQTVHVNVPGTGATGNDGNAYFSGSSSDGSRVLFQTVARLTAADTDDWTDVYERSGGVTTAVSPDVVSGAPTDNVSFAGASAEARDVAMETPGRLLTSDTDDQTDVYISRLPAPPPDDGGGGDGGDGAGDTGGGDTGTETTPAPAATQTTPATTPPASVNPPPTTTPAAKPKCVVPKLKGLTLKKAKAKLKKAHCALGKVVKKKAAKKSRGKVLTQKVKPKVKKPNGSKIAVTVGR
jgi:hypothetical protein